ncbi:MAG: DNA polymerase IV, partial [Proteobacteria bacterium]|nr:DNA polymerase IV [Pseudomonadota bacterium]
MDRRATTAMWSKAIIHLDMDAFYAAVEVLDNPSLKGKPVIVGGPHKRGVVSSASYESRKFGVHSAQPIATAMRLCPNGIFLPVRMSRYKEVSEQVSEIFYQFTPLVEPLSIDEAFLDVTGSMRLFGPPEEIAQMIKGAVFEKIGITVSAGVAPSKFVAKIASDLRKPDGLTVVPEEKVKEFLEPLPIEKLWGVGKVTQEALALLSVRTIGDLSRLPLEVLESNFGKHGTHLHLLSQGIDERDVEVSQEVKSIGHEETFADDLLDVEAIRKELLSLATRVSRRLRRHRIVGKTVTLKVKYHDFVQVTRSETLPEITDDGGEIFRRCCGLLNKTEVGKRPVRLLGISVSHLLAQEEKGQLSLFQARFTRSKRKKLNLALD